MSAIDTEMTTFLGATIGPGSTGSAEQAAASQAAAVRKAFGAGVGIAAVAPDHDEGHQTGTVFLGLAIGDTTDSEKIILLGGRPQQREYTVINLLDLVRRRLS